MSNNNDNNDRRDPPFVGPAMEALQSYSKTRFEILQFTEYERGKSSTCKLGAAFVNRDGSINLLFDALPIPGRNVSIQLREPKPREDNDQRGRGGDSYGGGRG